MPKISPYTPEIKEFIEKNCKGRYIGELTEMINKEFGTSFRKSQIKSYLSNHKLTTGTFHQKGRPRRLCKCKYPDELLVFLRAEAPGKHIADLPQLIKEKFGIEITKTKVAGLMKNNGIRNGLDTRLKPGHVPVNKGTKGMFNVGGNRTSFKKGHKTANKKPVGSERVTVDGYVEVKIADPNVWELKHRIIWEEANGKVPENHVITFIDGNSQNVELENLIIVSLQERLTITRNNLVQKNGDPDLNLAGINTAKLISAIHEKKRKRK